MKKAPQAYEVKNRPGLWAAKGIDPVTRARKNYFAKSASEASRKAEMSLGECQDHSLFAFYSAVYLPVVKHRSRNWLVQIAWAMDRYILPELGHRDIRELKRADLQLFFNKIGGKLKTSSVAKIKIVLSGIMRLAQSDEVISSNPVSFVRLPRPDPVEKTALTFEELHNLLGSAGPLVRPFIILAGGAGLRLGEAVGVTRGAIGKDGMLRVRQQVQQAKGGCVVMDQLKTDHSRREIPLPKAMLDALLECHQVSGIWICSDSIGGFVKPKNITRELRAACIRADVPFVTPHELRHTFISLMDNELEAPRPVVMALAGHSPQSITDGYSHTKSEQKLRWMERYWDRMSTTCSPKEWATEAKKLG